ncbi:hypothetical protein NM208_g1481 [Fusarium decemcellulare]|uniref:Uncharacterized protein n=1 Tax=Fusarium decemcellulare TaxID=57161 RepID=A0ACC1SVR8_9HYPO|nr:hypothetical protein NM208_g1481 [Fusarium decemcellulare]
MLTHPRQRLINGTWPGLRNGGPAASRERGYDRGRKGTAILQGVQSVFDLLTQPLHADDRRDDRREDRRAQYGVAALQQTPARKELMRDLQHANEENKGLREHLMKLEETCSQLKRRNDAMQSTRDAQEEFLGRQEPDSEISARFEEIFSQVKNWTNKFCNTKDAARAMEIDLIDPGLTSQIQRVMPKVRSIQDLPDLLPLKDIKRRKKFIRGWIALNVSEHMFRSLTAPHAMETGSDLWIPEAARSAVMVLEMTLLHSGEAIPQFAFHEWRVLTFALLNKIFPLQNWQQDTDDAITKVMQVTMEVIRPLVSSNVPLPELEKTLRQNIYEPAIELSQLLRRQRACWYVRFPHIMAGNQLPENDYTAPYIFQPDTMKDIDGLEEDEDDNAGSGHCLKAIDIVILPGLYKSGNHDGKKYDIEYLLLKAEVSCTEIVHQNVREGMAYTQPRETLEGA